MLAATTQCPVRSSRGCRGTSRRCWRSAWAARGPRGPVRSLHPCGKSRPTRMWNLTRRWRSAFLVFSLHGSFSNPHFTHRRSTKDIGRLSTSSYNTHLLSLVKSAKTRNAAAAHMRWTLHRHVSPVKIVSLRTTQGYMAPDEPKAGHRLLVHALVRFDTEQVRISPSRERCVGVDLGADGVLFRTKK